MTPQLWVAEVAVDPAWYELQDSPDRLPAPGHPLVVALESDTVLVGRRSGDPDVDVDCGSDSSVSRRQAELSTDGVHWWVEDLRSSNGTFVGRLSGALPEDPIPPGRRHELYDDHCVYVGGWTRLNIRPATEAEAEAASFS